MAKDRFDPNSQDTRSKPGKSDNLLHVNYGHAGGSKRSTVSRGTAKIPSSAPANKQKLRG